MMSSKYETTKHGARTKTKRLSLHPLSLNEALRSAMETGPPPDISRQKRQRVGESVPKKSKAK
jgi:hypothetical protein